VRRKYILFIENKGAKMGVEEIEQSLEKYYNREHGLEQDSTVDEDDFVHIVEPFQQNVLHLLKMFKVPYSKKEGKAVTILLVSL